MIYDYQLKSLLSQWEERASKPHEKAYCFALWECVNELKSLIAHEHEEEDKIRELEILNSMPDEEARQYLLEAEADAYLSSMECQ